MNLYCKETELNDEQRQLAAAAKKPTAAEIKAAHVEKTTTGTEIEFRPVKCYGLQRPGGNNNA